MLQAHDELEAWHRADDPWGFETHPDDARRKAVLLAELPRRPYENVLDIGCGQGFVTRDLPGRRILGVDVSAEAVARARRHCSERLRFETASLFDLEPSIGAPFDLVVVTGVLYPQYIGKATTLVYDIVDRLLADDGILVSVHIDAWLEARFPYLMVDQHLYPYREYTHRLEVYVK